MPLEGNWEQSREHVSRTLRDHNTRIDSLDEKLRRLEAQVIKSTNEQTLELTKSTAAQTLALKEEMHRISLVVVRMGVIQSVIIGGLVLALRYFLKVP